MEKWQNFEYDCCEFLSKKYGSTNIKFISAGGSDSTKSDIQIIKNNKFLFNIEAKMNNAQSGQFVVHSNDIHFYFSDKNKTTETETTKLIIKELNKNFEYFKTSDSDILLNENIFATWIKENYSLKNVKFIISKFKNKYIIFPLDKFEKYFSITAKYRVKKSGSSELSKSNIQIIEDFFGLKLQIEGKKKYLISSLYKNKQQFKFNNFDIQLSLKETNKFEVRQLSNTYNRNVIFSITSKREQDMFDLNVFIKELGT